MKLVYTNFNLPSDTISYRQCQLMILPGGIFPQCLFSLLQDLILLLQQVHNVGSHISINRPPLPLIHPMKVAAKDIFL